MSPTQAPRARGLYFKLLWLVTSVLLVVALALAVLLFITETIEVQEHGAQAANLAGRAGLETIHAIMRAGGSYEDIQRGIERLHGAVPELNIRVLRGEAVNRQFGFRGESPPAAPASRGGGRRPFGGWSPPVHTETPVLLERECTKCHNAPPGTVAGVIVTDFSLDGLYRIFRHRWAAVGLILASGLLLAGVLTLAGVRGMLLRPIEGIGGTVAALAEGRDVRPVVLRTGDELEVLAEQVSTMAARLSEARAADHDRYRTLFDGVPVGLVRSTPEGRFLDVNQTFVDMLGYPDRESLLAVSAVQIYARPDDRARWQATVEAGTAIFQHELQLLRYDGSTFWAHGILKLDRGEDGRTRQYDISVLEVTRRRDAEQRAREQAVHLQEIMATVPEGIVLLDPGHNVLQANPGAQALFGVEPGQVMGDLGGRPMGDFLRAASDADGVGQEVELADGRVLHVRSHPIAQRGGLWVLWASDVTREREVRARVEAQDRLAAIGQLAAGIAHDLNNMLQSVIGYSELLQMRSDLPASVQEPLEIIQEQGQRGAQMIRQVLDFSRRSPTEKHPVSLGPLLKEFLKLLRRTVPESIRLEADLAATDDRVSADVTQLQQVVTNLVINARDAMPEGGALRVSTTAWTLQAGARPPFPQMQAGRWLLLRVSDTGTGIPSDVLTHIFEPFFTTKPAGKGTGLGLAQVYGIVRQHDGFIDVDSRVGEGTTFTAYLPVVGAAGPDRASAAPSPVHRGHGETILLVEDEPLVFKVAIRLLETCGYQVLKAANGREALDVYNSHQGQVDLVLTDVVMPEMSGLTLVEALRQKDRGLKFVVMSGYPLDEGWRAVCGEATVTWLAKPVRMAALAIAVEQALLKGRA